MISDGGILPETRLCRHCGGSLGIRRAGSVYCSDRCRKAAHEMTRPPRPTPVRCRKCWTVITGKPIRTQVGRAYCSDSCRVGGERLRRNGRRPPRYCPICQSHIPRTAARNRRYCSEACRNNAVSQRHSQDYRARREARPVRRCKACNATLSRSSRSDRLYCNQACEKRAKAKVERVRRIEARKGWRRCRWCSGSIAPEKRATTVYCSPACSKKAWKLSARKQPIADTR